MTNQKIHLLEQAEDYLLSINYMSYYNENARGSSIHTPHPLLWHSGGMTLFIRELTTITAHQLNYNMGKHFSTTKDTFFTDNHLFD